MNNDEETISLKVEQEKSLNKIKYLTEKKLQMLNYKHKLKRENIK